MQAQHVTERNANVLPTVNVTNMEEETAKDRANIDKIWKHIVSCDTFCLVRTIYEFTTPQGPFLCF